MSVSAFAQYYSNDVTPAGAAAGKLTAAASGKQVGGGSDNHAYLVLAGNGMAATDLHPAGYITSLALSTDDTQQCGYAYSVASSGNHAMLWSGSAASAVDLHTIYTWTYCSGNHNGQQVGFGERPVYFTTTQHAMLWTGSAASAVDLHPVAFPYSKALGVHDGQQVGYGSTLPYPGLPADSIAYHTTSHAVVWTGTAASAVDLNPIGFSASEANATNGIQQGGWAYDSVNISQHAGLWSGTAASFVDLHPAGFTDSKVNAMTATKQVGEGWVGGLGTLGSVRHALVWQGAAASVVDLNQYLPAGYTNGVATGVDAAGNVVGYAYNTPAAGGTIPPDAIAVIFAPGASAPYTLNALTVSSLNPAPLSSVSGTVSIAAPAPANGVTVNFLSTDTTVLSTPLPVTIPAGQTTAGFSVAVNGGALQVPSLAHLYATDGTVRKSAAITVTPIVNLATVTLNAVEGGFTTGGTVTLTIPAQLGGATITLTSGNTTLVSPPPTVTIPQGQTQTSFSVTTASVPAPTTVPVTASFNGQSVSAGLSLTQAPVVAVASVSLPPVVGGQSAVGTLTLTNFPRAAAGAVVTLTSGDPATLQVPATVTVPYGVFSVTFTATTVVVPGQKGVSIKATYGTSTITTTVSVAPIPTITITQADYLIDLQMLKVAATTSFANSVLTFGTDPLSAPIGSMQFELGVFNGAAIMPTAPKYATVWNSNGGMATMLVTAKLSSSATGGGGTGGGGTATGGGGGGGATGGGGSTATYKLTITKNGKGAVTANPTAASYAPGTVVILTATPDPGFPWIGWGGACSGTATTCSLTMNANLSVVANFK
jgi:uncharacterized membrane protein YgcG